MTPEGLKLYQIRVRNASGCIFQPISNNAYTYVLTAKHLFEGISKDEDGNNINYSVADGENIEIYKTVLNDNQWSEILIPFTLQRGSTYFPHETADAVILKIEFQDGFDKIFSMDLPANVNQYSLCGFPERLSGNVIGNRDTSYLVRNLVGPAIQSYTAQLISGTLNKNDIEGMSGGGILSIKDSIYISLIGIQSEMKHSNWANGQINFVPMQYFNEIISYPENSEFLVELYPPYMSNFSFLRDESFVLEVDAINENQILPTRQLLRNQALNIINSNITPIGIKELFKNRLLIDENENGCLSYKVVWIAWLEFLTIMNLIKYEPVDEEIISEIFNTYRLKYSHTEDWTNDLLNSKLLKSDYLGLKPDSTIVISSPNAPKRVFTIPKGKIVDIVKVYDKSGFRTDKGMDPFTSFNFVHIDYFKTKCILNKLEEYQNLDEAGLITKLKQEYNELFK